jgi:outer membrane protein assembly factor BamB
VVYVGSEDGSLYAFPASCGTGNATCTPLWHGATGSFVESSPAVANGVVYLGSEDHNLYAFPASCGTGNATCAPLFRAPTGDSIESSPAVANGVVYVGSNDHSLYAFDLNANPPAAGAAVRKPRVADLHPNYSLRVQK